MKFIHSSTAVQVPTKKDARSKGLSANIRAVSPSNTLTIQLETGDNPASIYSTAARILGKGNYAVREVEKARANSPVRYEVLTASN